jgi:NlpC/P60 family protein
MAATGTGDGIAGIQSAVPGSVGAAVVDEVRKFLGDAYVYGATGPNTFDCSGLTQYVYKQLGVTIPRTSEEQFAAGTPVTYAEAQPGDLVFFGGSGPGYYYDGTPTSPGHVGIYIGDNQMINAPTTGQDVQVMPITGYVGFRRYSNQISGTNATVESLLGAAGTGGGSDSSSSSSSSGGLFSIPGQIVSAFSDIDTAVVFAYDKSKLFFQPSTYVRLGSGILGFGFVLTGLILMMKEART